MTHIDDMNGYISEPLRNAKDEYTVVVIGSGYGGAIAACRIAETKQKVAVLERGKEILPGDYPNTAVKALAETQYTISQTGKRIGKADALYDIRLNDDINVVLGCGLGGTSLINANVGLTPTTSHFKSERWPTFFRNNTDVLHKFMGVAAKALGTQPYPENGKKLPKLEALKQSADRLNADSDGEYKFERAPIYVTFKDGPNAFGFNQKACNLCGDCCSGCNYGAKNTTLMNYLPAAKRAGADIFTGAEVQWIEKTAAGKWNVHIHNNHAAGAEEANKTIAADIVILGAGSLGSTEILLRSQEKSGLSLSQLIGSRFSGNGDVLAFGYNANTVETTSNKKKRPPIYGVGAGANKPNKPQYQPGPTITGAIRNHHDGLGDPKYNFTIEEGVMPGALSMAYTAIFFMADALKGNAFHFGDTQLRLQDAADLGNLIQNHPTKLAEAAYTGPMSRTQCFLVMSWDDGDGAMSLKNDKLTISWPGVGKEPSIVRDNKILETASDGIWAEYLPNPIWEDKFGRKLITVHPVGGCCMGDDCLTGVTNAFCQVYDASAISGPQDEFGKFIHDGLYVVDGAVIPGAVGTNPSLTIAGIAEFACYNIINKYSWNTADTNKKHKPAKIGTPPANANTPSTSFGIDPSSILSAAISALTAIKGLIYKKKYDNARTQLKNDYNLIHMFAGKYASALPAWDTIEGYLTDDNLKNLLGPVIAEFMPTMAGVQRALKKKNYGKALKVLERDFGDFSPGLGFSEQMRGHISTERVARPHVIEDPYSLAEKRGIAIGENNFIVGNFKIHADSLEKMLADPGHTADLAGTVQCAELGGTFDVANTSKFQLLKEDESRVECWNMVYSATLTPKEGASKAGTKTYGFYGFKTLKRRPGSNWWHDLTTLSVEISEWDEKKKWNIVKRGKMHLGMQDLAAQGATVKSEFDEDLSDLQHSILGTLGLAYGAERLIGGQQVADALKDKKLRAKIVKAILLYAASKGHPSFEKLIEEIWLGQFGGFFAMLVFRTYGGVFAYLNNFPAADDARRKAIRPKPKRKIPAPKPKKIKLVSWQKGGGNRDIKLGLTRYQGGDKGPIVMAPGFGTTAASFAMETVDVNIVEYLTHQGYDVYLFDYRGSPALDATKKPFSIIDVALSDWPAAIHAVAEASGKSSIQCLGHCVGSMTLLLMIQQKVLNSKGAGEVDIRSVLSSQLTLHPVTSWFNDAKSDVHLASFLIDGAPKSMDGLIDSMGLPSGISNILKNGLPTVNMVSSTNPGTGKPDDPVYQQYLRDKALDMLLWKAPFPGEMPCYNPTCHRVFGVFGASYAHDQLNEATHNALQDVFGTVSSTPFRQLADMMRDGKAMIDSPLLPNPTDVSGFDMPIDFVAGSRNQIFYPETSLRTLRWLQQNLPKKTVTKLFTRKVFRDYAHMDFFIGKNANRDIFPYILKRLNKHN